MAWKVEYTAKAVKALRKLDDPIAERIRTELSAIAVLGNPRARGRALEGNLKGYWRYRIGDYRVICDIRDSEMIVYALKVAHRSEVYLR